MLENKYLFQLERGRTLLHGFASRMYQLIQVKKVYHDEAVSVVESIMSELKQRTWQLRSFIDYEKFNTMTETNPMLAKLRQKLDLDLDF